MRVNFLPVARAIDLPSPATPQIVNRQLEIEAAADDDQGTYEKDRQPDEGSDDPEEREREPDQDQSVAACS